VFALGADARSIAHKATGSEPQWEGWLRASDLSCVEKATVHGPGPIRAVQSYKLVVRRGGAASMLVCLSRGPNEAWALKELRAGLRGALATLKGQLAKDERFWSRCPVLEGDWPEAWKHGWVYDFETLRMNAREPIGIYKHHWDAMQVHSPRAVLGEASLDSMAMSYADSALAMDVLLGTFADAPAPNVPCSREDGSMNMIAADGSECGTTPVWGLPFHVIRSIYERTGNRKWLKVLYPHLKAFLDWWLANRTDERGWFHCKCSWESGQDGSKRFLIASEDPGGVAEFVRTVDVEAVMAEAMQNMAYFAEIVGLARDGKRWRALAEQRVRTTREMFVDGWFRDFDVRTNEPIILQDYVDIMMLVPLACGIATPEQVDAIRPKFQYFRDNATYWLEWPSFTFPFSEAAWNAGLRTFLADVLADIADRVYSRTDSPAVLYKDADKLFSYRVPGVANEYWPVAEIPAGGENYGWGATLPMDLIRSVIGFRETPDPGRPGFILAPSIPTRLREAGRRYAISHLCWRDVTFRVTVDVVDAERIHVELEYCSRRAVGPVVCDSAGRAICERKRRSKTGRVAFDAENGAVYAVRM
jgi:hypothetical protein